MPLSWNEIKNRALAFSKEWENTEREEADAKPFLVEFLNIFGIRQNRIATFEHKVKKLSDADGYIDLLWKGMLLVEMKSRGKDLDKAYQQAKDYCHGLKDHELPRLIMVCDFEKFIVFDEEGNKNEFVLKDLVKYVHVFALIAGYQKRTYKEQDPVNIQAAERMGKLHDQLKAIGYEGHNLELYLVRLLFCLFADDTGIFEAGIFHEWLENKTRDDGSDLAANISQLFQVLNTPEDKRLKVLDESFAAFPYVNGKLFEENLPVAAFNSQMRKQLLDCCALNWGKISPAIFGSLFQSVMDEKARRNLGAHYTSEKNILKLIKPLFLDELWKEYESVKHDKNKLKKLHDKISKLRFLDPACGCGNFLIIAYRELRLLELEIVTQLLKGQQVTSINDYFLIDVDQFYGIEYEEFPSQVAQVAMWLMDHQLNAMASLEFGEYYKRIPLKKSATIVQGNALRIDWQSLIDPMPWEKEEPMYHYILGNPPFIGTIHQNEQQKKDMLYVFAGVNGVGMLDYVCAWYLIASKYMIDRKTKCAFVSTNSISQGLQTGILWNELFKQKSNIHFAHQTFKWNNEAKGNAAVHVVIIGFANYDTTFKELYEYDNINGEPLRVIAKNINPYLINANNSILANRPKPICVAPLMNKGSQPTDGGYLLLSQEEKEILINKEPLAEKFIKRIYTNQLLLNNTPRWCLWLKNARPEELRKMPLVTERLSLVKQTRLNSPKASTKKWAEFPALFTEDRQPDSDYLLIPVTTSERRKYIPIIFASKDIICNNSCLLIPEANFFHFGVLHSLMHMSWVKIVSGRMKSDYQYSNTIVYNNFPWPENPSDKQKEAVEKAAQAVLDARAVFQNPALGGRGASLADLYDPNTMPPVLVKAHQALDKAVDLCYRPQPFTSEAKRIEYLFELYDKYTAGLFVGEKKKK